MGDINFNDFLLSENSSFSMVTKQINDLAKIKDDFSERMCNEIKRYYEEWDQKLRDKYSGGYNGYKLYGKREVTTITEWGHVTYQRTLFKYYDPNKLNKDGRYGGNRFVFLLDAEMGRKPYQRIHFDLYIKVLKELDSGKRYQDIIDKYKD